MKMLHLNKIAATSASFAKTNHKKTQVKVKVNSK